MLEDFKARKKEFTKFEEKVLVLIKDLIAARGVTVHQYSSRTKDETSLENKINGKSGKYKDLSDITDLVGFRIIAYLEKEVDEIAEIIEAEFEIDWENSVDRRKLELDKFGYKSLHYIINVHPKRHSLPEYSDFVGIKAEVQIRTILQHSWAEIQHDLGYKSEISLPDVLYRDFFRIAALLETADKEFGRVKDQIISYKEKVEKELAAANNEFSLNQTTLSTYSGHSQIIKSIAEEIAKICNIRLSHKHGDYDYLLLTFRNNKINTIQHLAEFIKQRKNDITSFYKLKLKKEGPEKIASIPYSIVYHAAAQLLLLENSGYSIEKISDLTYVQISVLIKSLRDKQKTDANML